MAPRVSKPVLIAALLASLASLAVLLLWSPGPSSAPLAIDEDGIRYLDRVFEDLEEHRGIAFSEVAGEAGLETLRMDVFSPADDETADRPIMIIAFGGGFTGGDRFGVEGLARDFAHRGYVSATIDYRLLEESPVDSDELLRAHARATHDGLAALRFLRSDPPRWGVRTDAAVMGGLSAGGFIGATAGTFDVSDPGTAPATLAYFDDNFGAIGSEAPGDDVLSEVQGILSLSGGLFSLDGIDPGDAVFFGAHHEIDPIVPCGTTDEDPWNVGITVHGSCSIAGRYAELDIAHGLFFAEDTEGHATFSSAQTDELTAKAAELFYRHVVQR